MNKHISRGSSIALIVMGGLFTMQCSSSTGTSPTASSVAPTRAGLRQVGDPSDATAVSGQVRICKTGNVSGTFNVAVVSGNPTVVTSPVTIAPGQCMVVATDTDQSPAPLGVVSVTETPATYLTGATIVYAINPLDPVFTNGGTAELNFYHGQLITFNNVQPPPTGTQGCTPGYWKQSQHFDSWKVYSTGADFDATFGVNFFNPNITLLDALGLNGGDINALARHGAAALLDAAAGSGVSYQYSTAQVIAIVRGTGAYAGMSVEDRKNLLDAANNGLGGCPLN